jgi:hypothetical protein
MAGITTGFGSVMVKSGNTLIGHGAEDGGVGADAERRLPDALHPTASREREGATYPHFGGGLPPRIIPEHRAGPQYLWAWLLFPSIFPTK